MSTDSVQAQFERVRAATTESHAMQYGDLSIGAKKLEEFLLYRAVPYKPSQSGAEWGVEMGRWGRWGANNRARHKTSAGKMCTRTHPLPDTEPWRRAYLPLLMRHGV